MNSAINTKYLIFTYVLYVQYVHIVLIVLLVLLNNSSHFTLIRVICEKQILPSVRL